MSTSNDGPAAGVTKPAHLEPSELGTKEYWDALYETEITNHAHDPSDTGTNWFDDSGAQDKVVEFLEAHFSSSSDLERVQRDAAFLDLGTGNGELLFGLRDAGWRGRMLGADYSERSVEFARRIAEARVRDAAAAAVDTTEDAEEEDDEDGEQGGDANTARKNKQTGVETDADADAEAGGETLPPEFILHDIISHPAANLLTGPQQERGWDVVLDKGTFDAISLSSALDDRGRRINEGYRDKVLQLVRPGGLFLITSCNWTEEELEKWFVRDEVAGDVDGFEEVARIQYRSFSFGGIKGQTISSLCFRKVRKS